MLGRFIYDFNRVNDIAFQEALPSCNTEFRDFTVADLDRYMSEITCPVMLAKAKEG